MTDRCEVLVVDSGGFLRNAPLRDLGQRVVTLREVVAEIKDKATKERLQVLPYELEFKEPLSEDIKIVTDFSKKTGDYASLSAVDLKVLALTYRFERELVGLDHIKSEPTTKPTVQFYHPKTNNLKTDAKLIGFYRPESESESENENEEAGENSKSDVLLPDIRAVVVKLPAFWANQPKVWFAQAEAQFILRGVTVDETKYYYLVAALDQETAKRVVDIISDPPASNKYESLKSRLLSTFMPSPYRMAQKLLDLAPLGDRSPSQMMDDMLALLGSHEPCILFRTLFVDALPQEVRPHLIPTLETVSPRDLALHADQLISSNSMAISAFGKKLSGSDKGTPKNSKDWCRFHRRWGSKAFSCITPCTFDQSNKSKIHAIQGNFQDDHQ